MCGLSTLQTLLGSALRLSTINKLLPQGVIYITLTALYLITKKSILAFYQKNFLRTKYHETVTGSEQTTLISDLPQYNTHLFVCIPFPGISAQFVWSRLTPVQLIPTFIPDD